MVNNSINFKKSNRINLKSSIRSNNYSQRKNVGHFLEKANDRHTSYMSAEFVMSNFDNYLSNTSNSFSKMQNLIKGKGGGNIKE